MGSKQWKQWKNSHKCDKDIDFLLEIKSASMEALEDWRKKINKDFPEWKKIVIERALARRAPIE